MSSLPHSTGQALDRVDGPAKVTGQARYAAEYPAADLLHGSVVSSDVARGRVRGIDCAAALAVPGVVAVLHHLNRPPMAGDDEPYKDADAAEGAQIIGCFFYMSLKNRQLREYSPLEIHQVVGQETAGSLVQYHFLGDGAVAAAASKTALQLHFQVVGIDYLTHVRPFHDAHDLGCARIDVHLHFHEGNHETRFGVVHLKYSVSCDRIHGA